MHTARPQKVLAMQVFNVSTLWVKFVSCAAAVGSTLPISPEGPMIHTGAMIGAALSTQSDLINCLHCRCLMCAHYG